MVYGQDFPCLFMIVLCCFYLLWHYMEGFPISIKCRQLSILLKILLEVIIFEKPAWVCQSSTCISLSDLSSWVFRPLLSHIAKILTLVWLFLKVSQTLSTQFLNLIHLYTYSYFSSVGQGLTSFFRLRLWSHLFLIF